MKFWGQGSWAKRSKTIAWLVGLFAVVGGLVAEQRIQDRGRKSLPPEILVQLPGVFGTGPRGHAICGRKSSVVGFRISRTGRKGITSNAYGQATMLLYIKRAARWFPMIENVLKQNGIPEDFKYLAVAESGLANAISSADAVGYWQFLAGTARQHGLQVNEEVDQRYDPGYQPRRRAGTCAEHTINLEIGPWLLLPTIWVRRV